MAQNDVASFYDAVSKCNEDDLAIRRVAREFTTNNPNCYEGVEVLITSYIKNGKQEAKALKLIKKWPQFAGKLEFLKAYLLYQLKRLEEAKSIAERRAKKKNADVKWTQLLASIYYMEQSSGKAVKAHQNQALREDVLERGEEASLLVNQLATYIQNGEYTRAQAEGNGIRERLEAGQVEEAEPHHIEDALLNIALAYERDGKVKKAKEILRAAGSGAAKGQLGYLNDVQGNAEAARKCYEEALAGATSSDKKVLKGNLAIGDSAAARGNIEETYRILQTLAGLKADRKLYRSMIKEQKYNLCLNEALLNLSLLRTDAIRSAIGQLQRLNKDSSDPLLLIASLLFTQGRIAKCRHVLQKSKETYGKLALAQTQMVDKDIGSVIATLSNIDDASVQSRPGFVATLAAILQHAGRANEAIEAVAAAIAGAEKAGDRRLAKQFRVEQAKLLMEQKRYEEARQVFKQLGGSGELSQQCHRLICACYAGDDNMEALGAEIPDCIGTEIDVDELLDQGIPGASEQKLAQELDFDSIKRRKEVQRTRRKERKKRKREQDGTADRAPNEKWLPKWQRKKFKGRRGRNKPNFRGAQGVGNLTES